MPEPENMRGNPKGVNCRNKALKWIKENAKDGGVLYFADDDNTYDVELFSEVSTINLRQLIHAVKFS